MIGHNNVTKFKSSFLILVILISAAAMSGGGAFGKKPPFPPGKPPGNYEVPILTIDKTMISGEKKVPTHTEVFWELEIEVANFDAQGLSLSDVVVKDKLPAEISLVNYTESSGTVEIKVKKETGITWTMEAMAPGTQTLRMWIKTNKNPAGKQRFTSPGSYELNYGAGVKAEHPTFGLIEAGPTKSIKVKAVKK